MKRERGSAPDAPKGRKRLDEGVLMAIVLIVVFIVGAVVYTVQHAAGRSVTVMPVHELEEPLTTPQPLIINVNTASAEELAQLEGIGEVLAQRIVEYRAENGPFTCAEDLLMVEGVGEAKLEAFRESISFE